MKKKKRIRKGIRKNIIDIIGMAFQKWWYNFIIVLPFVFSAIASVAGILLLFLIFGLIFVAIFGTFSFEALKEFVILGQLGGAGTSELSPETIQALLSLFSPETFIYVILVIIISVLALMLIKAYFCSGAIAMAYDIVKGKKTNLKVMTKAGWKFLWRFWLIKIVIALGIIAWLLIFLLPSIFTQNINLLWITLGSVVPLIFIYILFLLSEYFLVLEDLSAWKAIGKSISVVRANYWAMLGLGLLFVLMTAVAGFIPWVGWIASLIVFIPAQTIAFVIFVLERREKR